jgi:hypothetical protein
MIPSFDINVDELPVEYSGSFLSSHSNWIKTASTVESWSKVDSAKSTGGHNLNSRITPFRVDKTLRKGEYKLVENNGSKEILVCEEDLSKITSSFLRQVEDCKTFGPQYFDNAAEVLPRTRASVIESSPRMRGLNQSQVLIREIPEGIMLNNRKISSCNELIEELTSYVKTTPDKKVVVTFENISNDRAKAIIKSSQIKMEGTLSEGSVFNINKTKYDFSRAKVIAESNGDFTISLERKFAVRNANLKITLKGVAESVRTKVVEIVNRLFKRAQFENINFYQELKAELKANKIFLKDEDIKIEIQDCIIAEELNLGKYDGYC